MKFSCCKDDFSVHTEYIKRKFAELENTDAIDAEFMKKTTERISVKKDGTVTLTLINKANLKGRG